MSKNRAPGGESADAEALQDFKIGDDPRYVQNREAMGNRGRGALRVIGGLPVPRGEFLDCVAVGPDHKWDCSGTLIGPNVVLTAGHCELSATRVYFGSNVDEPGLIVPVARRVLHPQYSETTLQNDLMVLILGDRVEDVAPRKLATKAQIDAATDGRIIGFGYEDSRASVGLGLKRMADVPIVSTNCRGKINRRDDRDAYGCFRGLEIVAGRPMLMRDSCAGDSGGPFYISDGGGGWLLAGSTSRTTRGFRDTCGNGGVYVRVDGYRKWIAGIRGVELA